MLSQRDQEYWLWKEQDIVSHLVDLADYGFVIDRLCYRQGLTDDPRCRLRKGAAEALVKAREHLPAGHNFKICEGWRPWAVQEQLHAVAKQQIRRAHPDWNDAQVEATTVQMAPGQRILAGFGFHRYGGAVDLTLVGPDGQELDVGAPVHDVVSPESRLLYYEFRDDLTSAEQQFRDRRRVLLRAMESARFESNFCEFWHWRYHWDMK